MSSAIMPMALLLNTGSTASPIDDDCLAQLLAAETVVGVQAGSGSSSRRRAGTLPTTPAPLCPPPVITSPSQRHPPPPRAVCVRDASGLASLVEAAALPGVTRVVVEAPPGLDPMVVATVLEMGSAALMGRDDDGAGEGIDPDPTVAFAEALSPLAGRARLETVVVASSSAVIARLHSRGGVSGVLGLRTAALALCEALEVADHVALLPCAVDAEVSDDEKVAAVVAAMTRPGCAVSRDPAVLPAALLASGAFYLGVRDVAGWEAPPWARNFSQRSSSSAPALFRATRPFDPAALHRLLIDSCVLYEQDRWGDLRASEEAFSPSSSHSVTGVLCGALRVDGCAWLAGHARVDVEAALRVAGGHASLEPVAPWSAAVVDDGEGESAPPQPPRQELWILPTPGASATDIVAALEACLVPEGADDAEPVLDPFAPWPSVAELAGEPDASGADDDDDACSVADDLAAATLRPREDLPLGGRAWNIRGGGAELASVLAGLGDCPAAVVEWRAPWAAASVASGPAFEAAACSRPDVAFLRIDVTASPENERLAFERVLTRPTAIRKDHPVLKGGGRFPCWTAVASAAGGLGLHLESALFVGNNAASELTAWLAAAVGDAPTEGSPKAATLASWAAEELGWDADGDDGVDAHAEVGPALTDGAAGLKGLLAEATGAGHRLVVVWRAGDGADGPGSDAAIASAAAALGPAVTLVPANAAGDPAAPNCRLAQALSSVSSQELPAATVFYEGKVAGKSGPSDLAADGGLAAALVRLGVPPFIAATNRDPWQPPVGRAAKAGLRRDLGGGKRGVLWPRMPCLRCGCPWWSSEEWDARCCRCRWHCESRGYDDDSQPLPEHADDHRRFVAEIVAGKLPAWTRPAKADAGGGDDRGRGGQGVASRKSGKGKSKAGGSKDKGTRQKGQWTKFY